MKEILIPLSINESASANIFSSYSQISKTFHRRSPTVSDLFLPLFCDQPSAKRKMADNLRDEFLLDVNHFRRYRGQRELTRADLNYLSIQNYHYPSSPIIVAPPFSGWQNLAVPEASPALSPWEEDLRERFLAQTIPEITADPAQRADWKGIKYLGGGGGGRVGLWEYTGQEDTAPNFRRVAVKEVRVDDPRDDGVLQEELFKEGKRLERLQEAAQSSHIITLQAPLPGADAKGEGSNAQRQGKIRRLVFEYCDMGDLLKLIEIRLDSYVLLEWMCSRLLMLNLFQ